MTLLARDALCSQLGDVNWPEGTLLDVLTLPPQVDVLDIGAGEGRLLRELHARGHVGRVVGLDARPSEDIHGGSAEALPYSSDSFDVVLLVRTLAHLQDPLAALRGSAAGTAAWRAAGTGGAWCGTWRALGRSASERGPDAAVRETLIRAGLSALRLDARVPIRVTAEAAAELVRASSLHIHVNEGRFPVRDTLQLTLYVALLS